MKKIIFVTLLLFPLLSIADGFYLMVGAGYKFNEPDTFVLDGVKVENMSFGHSMSCMAELGYEWYKEKGWGVKMGLGHHSQCLSGAPFNNDDEYYKDELFIHGVYRF